MAITNVDHQTVFGGAPGQPIFIDIVQLDLDTSYPQATGGYPDFTETLESDADFGKGKTILSVRQNNTVGGTPTWVGYDRANDKLKCYDWAGAEHANGTNLGGVVDLELVIFSK